jgi:hypothetical protein
VGGVLLAAWLSVAQAQSVCPSRSDALTALENAVATVDFESVDQRLEDVTASFACGKGVQPDELARLWVAEGAFLHMDGDVPAAEESFQAARRVAPDTWTEVFGSKLRTVWEDAPEATERGTIAVDPKPLWWTVLLDGKPVPSLPYEVSTGLHVVQGGPSIEDVRFAKVLYVRAGGVAVALHDEKEGPAPKAADPQIAAKAVVPTVPRWTLQTAAGAAFALGRAERNEPAMKVPLSLDLSVLTRLPTSSDGPRNLWVRGGVSAMPLLDGQWALDGVQGPEDIPNALGAYAAVGGRNVQGDVGGLVGYQWPGRAQIRALAALELGDLPFAIEPRVGLNIGHGVEPAVELLVAYRPALIW